MQHAKHLHPYLGGLGNVLEEHPEQQSSLGAGFDERDDREDETGHADRLT